MNPSENQMSFTPLSLENITMNYPLGSNTMLSNNCPSPNADKNVYRYMADSISSITMTTPKTPVYINNAHSNVVASPSIPYSLTHSIVSPSNDSNLTSSGYPYQQYTNNSSLPVTPGSRSYYVPSTDNTPNRPDTFKSQKVDKNSKGLRHFSMKVLQKVRAKGVTTYNEVADDLVREFGSKTDNPDQRSYDHKNIRRRVYDALNVLMAMNIINKEKKEIKWVGLPINSVQECQGLNDKLEEMKTSVQLKLKLLRDLIIQEVCLKNLITSNEEKENTDELDSKFKMELPFAAITTTNSSTVDCSVTAQRDDYYFSFEAPFEIYDESEIMRKLGFSNDLEKGYCSQEKLEQSKALLPRSLHPYVDAIGCCTEKEFNDLILEHKKYLELDDLQSDHVYSNTLFIEKLLESCNKKRLPLQMGDITYIDEYSLPPTSDKDILFSYEKLGM